MEEGTKKKHGTRTANSKMADLLTSVITLNVNRLSAPIKGTTSSDK